MKEHADADRRDDYFPALVLTNSRTRNSPQTTRLKTESFQVGEESLSNEGGHASRSLGDSLREETKRAAHQAVFG
jgi:hypothetical protein